MDLNQRRHNLFVDTAAPPPASNKTTTRTRAPKGSTLSASTKIRLPIPSFNVRATDADVTDRRIHFFPSAADRRVFCLDQSGRGFLMEADTPRMVMMPRLHRPKLEPISLYVPYTEPDFDDLDGGGGGNLFIMDRRITKPEPEGVSGGGGFQFEALLYRMPDRSRYQSKTWYRELVPPPPPYGHGGAGHSCLEISSYAVVKAGSQICVSVDGNGTYCLDVASDTATYDAWSEVGKWTLPFRGEVQYAPELKLWFGFAAEDQNLLAAADLSAMDSHSQPQLLNSWKELEPPKGWQQVQDPQLVSLGSRRFCIARFFCTTMYSLNVTVLTGVEVVRGVNLFPGNFYLEMIKHKSLCHKSGYGEDTITAVF